SAVSPGSPCESVRCQRPAVVSSESGRTGASASAAWWTAIAEALQTQTSNAVRMQIDAAPSARSLKLEGGIGEPTAQVVEVAPRDQELESGRFIETFDYDGNLRQARASTVAHWKTPRVKVQSTRL